MSDTLPSAPVAATVPPVQPVEPLATGGPVTTPPAAPESPTPLVVPVAVAVPTAQWRVVKTVDIDDAHYEAGSIAEIPVSDVHGLALVGAIEPIRVDYTPPAPPVAVEDVAPVERPVA